MVQRPTLKDVAERAGVHVGTASRALSESSRHLVSNTTLGKVLAAAQALGYTHNVSARTLRTERSSAVGMLLPDLTNPIFPPMVRGAEDVLRDLGYSVWIANTDGDAELESAAIASFRQRSVDGYIFATARLDHPLIEEMYRTSTPLVLVNRRLARTDVPAVTSDDAHGTVLALTHLYELGHREIVYVAGPQEFSTGLHRKRAFVQSMKDLGLPAGPDRVAHCVAWSAEAGRYALGELLDAGRRFTAVLAGNDLIGLGCFDALRERGLSCPADVSVVGFDDTPFMDRVAPPMTTIRISQYELGQEAARLLVDILNAPERRNRSLILAPVLVVRCSAAPPGRGSVPP
ncbi:substrate-binding domain-containing protein [Pseudonocardia yunnanensis]